MNFTQEQKRAIINAVSNWIKIVERKSDGMPMTLAVKKTLLTNSGNQLVKDLLDTLMMTNEERLVKQNRELKDAILNQETIIGELRKELSVWKGVTPKIVNGFMNR